MAEPDIQAEIASLSRAEMLATVLTGLNNAVVSQEAKVPEGWQEVQ